MIKNLSKDNFFNPLRELYPEAVELFCKWIDEYKAQVAWQQLFAPGVKFHDIPLEMQLGILVRFEYENFEDDSEPYEQAALAARDEISELFKRLQNKLNHESLIH